MDKPLSDQNNQAGLSLPPRPGRLDRLSSVRLEMARLYRAAKSGRREAAEAARLIWMLREIRGCLEGESIERLEAQMKTLEQRLAR
jgi:hypothetical protein